MDGYMPGEIRHRMLKTDYEIRHFSDSSMDSFEMHHHDFYEIYFLLSGSVTFFIDSREFHVLPGDVLLISPMELHQCTVYGGTYERMVLWINGKTLIELSGDEPERLDRCFDLTLKGHANLLRPNMELSSRLKDLMGALYSEQNRPAFLHRLGAQNLLSYLCVLLNRVAEGCGVSPEPQDRAGALAAQAVDYIGTHYSEELSLETVAAALFVSKYHLSHEFARHVGVPLYAYIIKKRLVMARQKLREGVAPAEACRQCGFGEYTNFYKAFKSTYGQSPREYARHGADVG